MRSGYDKISIMKGARPYFLWDYNLTNTEVKELLKKGNRQTRLWLIGRIIESAKFKDVFKYFTLSELVQVFPQLKLRQPIKNAWQRALKVWGAV